MQNVFEKCSITLAKEKVSNSEKSKAERKINKKFFSPVREYTKEEIEEINKRLLKIDDK